LFIVSLLILLRLLFRDLLTLVHSCCEDRDGHTISVAVY
jgi:hypothetical protein